MNEQRVSQNPDSPVAPSSGLNPVLLSHTQGALVSRDQVLITLSPQPAQNPSWLHHALTCSELSLTSATYTPQLHALGQDLRAPTFLCFMASTQAVSCMPFLNALSLLSLCS